MNCEAVAAEELARLKNIETLLTALAVFFRGTVDDLNLVAVP